jgi:hypothetical protein
MPIWITSVSPTTGPESHPSPLHRDRLVEPSAGKAQQKILGLSPGGGSLIIMGPDHRGFATYANDLPAPHHLLLFTHTQGFPLRPPANTAPKSTQVWTQPPANSAGIKILAANTAEERAQRCYELRSCPYAECFVQSGVRGQSLHKIPLRFCGESLPNPTTV